MKKWGENVAICRQTGSEMSTRYRRFTDDFHPYLHRKKGWPPYREVRKWFRREKLPYTDRMYQYLRDGQTIDENYAVGLIRHILDRGKKNPSDHFYLRLEDYFNERKWPPLAGLPVDQVIERVCTPPDDKYEPPPAFDIPSQGLLGPLAEYMKKGDPKGFIQGCKDEEDVNRAIDWMFVEVGRALAGDPLYPMDAARNLAAEKNLVTQEEYTANAIEWSKLKWPVVLARGEQGPVGMSIWFPLTADAYGQVLEGEKMSYEVTLMDFEIPSSTLVLESASARPIDMGCEEGNPTRQLSVAIIAQGGALAFRLGRASPKEIRMLSFPGTPLNEIRLRQFGFQSTGRIMRGTGFPTYELKLKPNGDLNQRILWGMLEDSGRRLPGPPPL